MRTYKIVGLLLSLFIGSACSDFMEVVPEASYNEDAVFNDTNNSANFLGPGYGSIASSPNLGLEYYTDNAVLVSGPKIPAVSGYTVQTNPVAGNWSSSYSKIFHINEWFKSATTKSYDNYDPETGELIKHRQHGEAYGLRAYYKWILLKNFAGPSESTGEMLGFPIIDSLITIDVANTIPRATYKECYESIVTDIDSALNYIDFLKYSGDSDVTGVQLTGRISGNMLYSLKARLALFAASNAYQAITKQEGAELIYDCVEKIDGGALVNLQAFGNFDNTQNPDHLYRKSFSETGSWEKDNFPPSLYGSGKLNPTQNLVDAFPDSNGYPITHSNSIYDTTFPYFYRDKRFSRFIFHNGMNSDFRNVTIGTYIGGEDASGGRANQATRTGYYMKKYLSADVNFDPNSKTVEKDYKIYPIFTREALYLDLAEISIEAYGASALGGSMQFSGLDALRKVRERAGIITDNYLTEISGDADKLVELVRNERRIEMCFEGERYYDVRRWKLPLTQLTQPVKGIRITQIREGEYSYEKFNVENRSLQEHMYYNPIPRNEVFKSSAIEQNKGWENY